MGVQVMKEPEVWRMTKGSTKSALTGMTVRPHWTVRVPHLSKGSIRYVVTSWARPG